MNALVLTALLFMVVNSVTSVTALTSDAAAQIIAAPDKGDELEDRAYADEQQELEVEIDTRDPNATITTDIYSFVEPTEYVIGLLLDPCRNHAVDCCVDRFGEPAYVDSSATIAEQVSLVDESGATLDVSVSRIGDRPSIFDQNCYLDDNLVPYRLQKTLSPSGLTITRNYTNSRCIGRLRALVPMAEVVRPACWDYNDSINALASCYNVDGRKRDTCVAVGFMQNSYIVQCGGSYELSNHCVSERISHHYFAAVLQRRPHTNHLHERLRNLVGPANAIQLHRSKEEKVPHHITAVRLRLRHEQIQKLS
ncbi:hypothetical protein PF010_g10223 [Phytophthora fragariae]|uniref:Uncharacterized protein n=1 Tax=Phytophthora fragariae TaxID=53985 RepID=A0A6G0LA33_9STRA|nr:hypothetical protein PF010_g10223 [Phytophthora fragariae]KAE9242860.1 hypothetical protein PF004_g6425 [Phytophthora fragariae]